MLSNIVMSKRGEHWIAFFEGRESEMWEAGRSVHEAAGHLFITALRSQDYQILSPYIHNGEEFLLPLFESEEVRERLAIHKSLEAAEMRVTQEG